MKALIPFGLLSALTVTGALARPGNVTLASSSDDGTKGNSDSRVASLSADGTAVAFFSYATNLDPEDTDPFSDVS